MMCAALIGLAALSSQAQAQQKTVKACESEWSANKAEYQAKRITEKAYVAQCRAGVASTQSMAAPAPAVAPGAKPAPAAMTAPRTTSSAARPAPAAPTTPTGANQFSSEAQAKARCPTDTVVWVNLNSGVYHFPGRKTYGQTKKGAYMCERDTAAAGFHAAKNEKRP
jgi:hypothetical protein